MDKTVVIFRKDRPDKYGFHTNDVFALMPEIPTDMYGDYCVCYQHIGQHGSANYHLCIRASKPASPEEYAELKAELERYQNYAPGGWDIHKRATPQMHTTRHKKAGVMRKLAMELQNNSEIQHKVQHGPGTFGTL
jgi:hypothetical protein